ncbi:1,6-anhydro-N-acetylmuramyl-L-alanine amidase AmpD [Herbaspirillum seropedicae]|uniref:1,6-anhydro-N-acetylmuramyl-L-alanine amidase AmpD n=1 Tax=Herbaspirillum seropedicae (strain SmR1) TaxID=757424 RepID=D8IWA6_HERSS|nr:1,6-anhydro-N-acetylmuramyl-L-alanine amidase AmpD [Herbaspirillum seropedicae]ADJ61904.1 anhydro-N-acetylmuramyl-tripeptide amidase protein [Herbaspirillum seropedicae SmR1]AKN64090.1 N-acetyl-anhydromuranmyl-L-alanine amidase [Herbaspirillum seropedicae]NQE29464.1 N-acetyl-anhydromuranmyl-L-alanine amidase [Herbaspirillum seropedicae]UMU20001.1 1,6-anhydro-N-acetylmuramyl-L-alanine amidase AmpD [Herbaspirillum seropedicae]
MTAAVTDPAAWSIDGEGWCQGARREPSPNCDDRPEGVVSQLLVIHNISLPPGEFGGSYIADLFCNRLDFDAHPYFDQLRPLRVSAHFLIRRDGEVVQFVPAHRRAWHAGVSSFEGRERCNDFSIGIELEGTDFTPFTPAQYDALLGLSQALVSRYGLSAVAGHEHIAPLRKTDPGPFFDWQRYREEMMKIVNPAQLRFPSGLHKSQA